MLELTYYQKRTYSLLTLLMLLNQELCILMKIVKYIGNIIYLCINIHKELLGPRRAF